MKKTRAVPTAALDYEKKQLEVKVMEIVHSKKKRKGCGK